jgi:hypothetical protein
MSGENSQLEILPFTIWIVGLAKSDNPKESAFFPLGKMAKRV